MKFNCGKTYAEKCDIWEQWHQYFAWLPVRVASRDCRWLETVNRKGKIGYGDWSWEYRACKP